MKKLLFVFGVLGMLFVVGCEKGADIDVVVEEEVVIEAEIETDIEVIVETERECLDRVESTEFAEYNYRVCLTGAGSVDGEIKQLIDELSEDVMFAGKELVDLGSAGKGGLYITQVDFSSISDVKSVLLIASINTGGAHPNAHFYTWSYREDTGQMLRFSSLFQAEHNPMWMIAPMVKEALMNTLGEGTTEEMIDAGINADNFEEHRNFVLDGDKLVLLFAPYEVAPYALGPQKVEILLSDLNAILAPPFLEIDGEYPPAVDYGSRCVDGGGKWLSKYGECEGVSQEWCEDQMGKFRECESACRHSVGEVVACTMQCVLVCQF